MASLQGNCTSSNTTRQARHASLAWSLYIVRTSNIAKNRHKHRFASGTVPKNRHLYTIVIRLDPPSPEKTPSPGDRRLSTYSFFDEYGRSIDRLFRSGNVGLTHSLMKHLAKWEPEKKDPLRGSFFSYRPSAGAAPRSVPTQQTVYVVAPTLQLLTISLAKPFLSNTT